APKIGDNRAIYRVNWARATINTKGLRAVMKSLLPCCFLYGFLGFKLGLSGSPVCRVCSWAYRG
ncbi:hypothetical protein, partial [Kingella kingae]|uniref:hypothetical protein n=1 Tax=Kingella kingae TaxID=504 RepID=UPI001E5D15EA